MGRLGEGRAIKKKRSNQKLVTSGISLTSRFEGTKGRKSSYHHPGTPFAAELEPWREAHSGARITEGRQPTAETLLE